MAINSKQKGKAGELEFANLCKKHGYKDARRSQQYAGINNDDDVVGLPGIHVEVKRVERLNVSLAMEQATRDKATSDKPIVAHRKNHEPWLITMLADDWFRLYAAYLEQKKEVRA